MTSNSSGEVSMGLIDIWLDSETPRKDGRFFPARATKKRTINPIYTANIAFSGYGKLNICAANNK